MIHAIVRPKNNRKKGPEHFGGDSVRIKASLSCQRAIEVWQKKAEHNRDLWKETISPERRLLTPLPEPLYLWQQTNVDLWAFKMCSDLHVKRILRCKGWWEKSEVPFFSITCFLKSMLIEMMMMRCECKFTCDIWANRLEIGVKDQKHQEFYDCEKRTEGKTLLYKRLYKEGQAKPTEVSGFRISGGTTHGDDNNLEHRWTHGRAKHIWRGTTLKYVTEKRRRGLLKHTTRGGTVRQRRQHSQTQGLKNKEKPIQETQILTTPHRLGVELG